MGRDSMTLSLGHAARKVHQGSLWSTTGLESHIALNTLAVTGQHSHKFPQQHDFGVSSQQSRCPTLDLPGLLHQHSR